MEEIFYEAARRGKVGNVKEMLWKNPNLNVNWSNDIEGETTALFTACGGGHDSIVSILLAHPDINVNQKEMFGVTPFLDACSLGRTSCVRLLLKDSRVLVNEPSVYGNTPLYWAAYYCHLDAIRWLIASGREVDLGEPGNYDSDAIAVAKKRGKKEVVALLERFKENPKETRYAMRVELSYYEELAAEMFALVVFVSDGLLQVNDTTTPAAGFFRIAAQLPLELQMVLCFRQVESSKEIISGEDSEVAFEELARKLHWASFFTH